MIYRVGIVMHGRAKRLATISFVMAARRRRVFCAKSARPVIDRSGVEKLPKRRLAWRPAGLR